MANLLNLSRSQKFIIFAVSFGTLLECYELYLYVFWAPVISFLFFNQNSTTLSVFNTVAIFALGFIFRPLGGIFFGRFGDRFGRKKSFILSILCMTLPTFAMGVMPVYSQIGIFAPILLGVIRILQTIPVGGELPGAFCYLYENAIPKNRIFMTSFAAVGNLIGIALSAIECYLLEKHLNPEDYVNWGWRISFILGGIIGLASFYLRYRLHETKLFQEMIIHHKMHKTPIHEVVKNNWRKILQGIYYGASQTSSFHLISILFPVYLHKNVGMSYFQILILLIVLLSCMAIFLPIFGRLGDIYGSKKLAILASLGMLILFLPLYLLVNTNYIQPVIFVLILFALSITCIISICPFLISDLFHTSVRYTCIGLSFNISDGVFGGLSTLLTLYLLDVTKNPGSFVWVLLVGWVISFVSFLKIKKSNSNS